MSGSSSECHNCGYPTDVLHRHQFLPDEEPLELCDVCYRTFLGHATGSSRHCDVPKLYKSVAYVANMVLAEIRELKEKQGEPK